MGTWKISSEIEPNYAGGLMRAKWLIGGVRTVKTLTQRNAIPALYRYFSAEESTIVFVEDESQLYRLNNNPSGVTTNADWTLISFGNVSSALTPIGTWNIDNTTPVLSDAGASGLNGNFYFVAGAPTPVEVTISGLFEGEPVTLVDGNMIISVGTRWVVVSNSTAWNSIDKPQSIIDYVAGTVIAHTHTVADISDLGSYLTNYLTRNDVADPDIDFEAVPDSDIISSEFIKKYYYRKTEVDSALSSFAQSFLELTDTPSSYSGFASKLVQVNATGTALEFVDPPATDLTSVLTEGNDAGGFEIINLGLGTQPTSALRRTDILDVSGILKTSLMPASVMERVYVYAGVETLPENAELTTTQVQNGDVVKMNSTGVMYVVVDDTQLNLALGYTAFNAGIAASVPWAGITDKPTTIAGFGITDAWKTSGTTSLAANTTIDGDGFDAYFITQESDLSRGSEFLLSKFVVNLTSTQLLGTSSIDVAEDITLDTTRDFYLTSPNINWIPGRKTFTAGATISFSGSGLTPAGGGNSIIVGEGIAISQDYSWSAIFGDVYALDAIFNNGLMAGTGHTLSGGPVGSGQVFGNGNILSGESYKLHDLISGSSHTYNTTGIGIPNASSGNFMFGKSNTISGTLITNSFAGGSLSQVSAAGAFAYGYPIAAQTTRPIISSGVHAFNFSANSSSQTSGHGALANYSVILGGQDHNIPSDSPGTVILGGNGIKARAASVDWTYTTNLNTLGSVLFASAISDAMTTSTRADIRGIGTGVGVGLRVANSSNTTGFRVADNGTVMFGSNDNVSIHPHSISGGSTLTQAGSGLTIRTNASSEAGNNLLIKSANNIITTTGTVNSVTIQDTFLVSSGTASYKTLNITPTFNTSGTYVGSVYGIDYNPTLTGVTGLTHYAARFVSGNILIGAASTTFGAKLEVRGAGTTNATHAFRVADANNVNTFLVNDRGAAIVGNSLATIQDHHRLVVTATNNNSTDEFVRFQQANGNGRFSLTAVGHLALVGETYAPTGGAISAVNFVHSFTPSSGNATFKALTLASTYGTSGTYSGSIIGIDYNPTLTSLTGATHYAMWLRSGFLQIGADNQATRFYASNDGTTENSFSGRGLVISNAPASIPTYSLALITRTSSHGYASGTGGMLKVGGGFTNTTGTGNFTSLSISSAMTSTGTHTGTYIGIDYDPTIINTGAGLTHYAALFRKGKVGIGLAAPTAKLHVQGDGTTTGQLFSLNSLTPVNKLLVLDDGTGTVNGTWTWATGQVGIGATPIADTKLYVKGASSTSLDYAAILENAIGEAIAKFRNDLSFEMGGTSAILEVNDGIESGNAAIRFLTFSTGSGLGFRFQDKSFNDYLNFRSLLTDRAAVFRQPVEYDFNQGEKRVTKQYTVTTDTVAAAQTVIFEFTLADADHYDIKVLHAEATATDSTSITSLGVDCADVRKIAATNIEGNTVVATQSRLPSGVVSGTFNWNLDTTNQKIQYRFQNLTGTGKEFVIWCDISYVKRITPITS